MAVALLRNPIKNYDWGSHTEISALQGRAPSPQPEAELWMGAYPESPSDVLVDGGWLPLDQCLDRFVPESVQARFGPRLPFLMKYLAIARPLSIQVHPDDDAAGKGFPGENFKDPYGKPELIYALTPLEMLVGFAPEDRVKRLLTHIGNDDLAEELDELTSGQLFVDTLSDVRLLEAIRSAPHLARELTWLPEILISHPHDPAAVAPLFMNHVHLTPGQAMYVPAGTVHCYLSGFGIEVMSNSDNVIRAGMTSKPVDLGHFVKHADLRPSEPRIISPTSREGWEIFPTPALEFELSRVALAGEIKSSGLGLIACDQGSVEILTANEPITMRRGDSVIVGSDEEVTISGEAVLYRCALPTP